MIMEVSTKATTNNNTVPQFELYEVPTSVVVIFAFFYGVIFLFAIVGNSFVIWIIVSCRRMKSVTNFFIANLAVADLILALLSIPFWFQAALLQRWDLPHFMCALCPFIQVLSVNVSIFTLTAIAVDRYRAVMSPLGPRPTKSRTKLIIAGMWIFGIISSVPYAVSMRVIKKIDPVTGASKPFCQNYVIQGQTWRIYNYILVGFQYFIPLLVVGFVYCRMGIKLWCSTLPGNAEGNRDANVLKNKKKACEFH